MNGLPIQIPLKCEWSYTWNKSINAKDSCPVRLIKSITALLRAIFCTHTVSKTEAYSVYDNHRKSVFGKEYCKLYDRKINASDDTHSNEKNGVPEKAQEKITIAETTPSNNSGEEEPDKMPKNITASKPDKTPKNITASEPDKMPTQIYSPQEFKNLMRNGQFLKNTHYIVTGHLDLNQHERTMPMPQHVTVRGRTYANRQSTSHRQSTSSRVNNLLTFSSIAIHALKF